MYLSELFEEVYLEEDGVELLPEFIQNYGVATVVDRSIPDARDGLKPVHRRILYTFYKQGYLHDKKFVKQLRSTGQVSAFHPHGDASVNTATSYLSQPWRYRVPFIDMHGNNGNIDGDEPAQARYVENRLTLEAEQLLDHITMNNVDMRYTYDRENKEPVVLPAKWPVLFTNGTPGSGMAYGFSTYILPHNPVELLKGAELLNREPDSTLSQVMRFVKGPDFPTGGVLMGRDAVKEIYKTGRGRVTLRAKTHIEGQTIHITEIPFDVTKANVFNSIKKVILNEKVDYQIKDIQDNSSGEGIDIYIELKRGYDPEVILNLLLKKSMIQKNMTAQHIAILDGKPKLFGLVEYLESFLDFRRETIRREFYFEYEQNQARMLIVEGFIKLAAISDKVILMIRQSDGRSDVIEKLQSQFKFKEPQAKAIADMPLHRISRQDVMKLEAELEKRQARKDFLIKLGKDDTAFREYMSEDLLKTADSMKHFKRQTELEKEVEDIEIDETALIKEESVYVVAKATSFQRMSPQMYSGSIEKYEESVIVSSSATTLDEVVFFTQEGRSIQRKVIDLEHLSLYAESDPLFKVINTVKSTDQILNMVVYNPKDVETLEILSVTRLGQIKRSPLSKQLFSFDTAGYLKRSKVYNGLKLEGDEVLYVEVARSEELDQMTLKLSRSSKRGSQSVVAISEVNTSGPTSSGANYLKMKDDEFVIIDEIIKGE